MKSLRKADGCDVIEVGLLEIRDEAKFKLFVVEITASV